MFLEHIRWLVFAYSAVTSNACQFFITNLDVSKFSQDFMWGGREFQWFGPKDLVLLLPNLTWLTLGTSRLSLY